MSQNKEKSTGRAARQGHFEWAFLHPRYWPLWLIFALLRLLVMLPLPVQHSIGRVLGRQFYRRNEKRRRIAQINIDLCFPELSGEEKDQLVLRHFEAYGASIFDLAIYWWASSRRLERLTTVHGFENFQKLIDQGQNVVLLTGHMLTVDLCGQYFSRYRAGVTMMKPLANPVLNYLLFRSRSRNGNQVINRDQGLRPLIRYIRKGYTGYFMPDEDFGSPASVFAPFFGVQSWTVTSLSALARLGNAVVMPVFMNSLPGGKGYELYFGQILENFPSGDDLVDATNMNQALEAGIRRMPEMYSWTFKLFKTRPAGEEAPY
ncbi:lipid A biosynthesis lauroyl acyltransferase [bacterium BMS3Abin11]|nr:lipid A biosynthesis lauroyl acyltransferase [bacterium BMS3Abin11]HDH08685.1 lipid A biosynthesis acyltransferase [Gammaproteobacteria bacterium]HDZ78679.1 lipid A biosynthesis acyltransferase [Gammaproteobacteria bacterium]